MTSIHNRALAARQDFWPAHLGYRPDMKFMAPEALPELSEELLRRAWSEVHIRGVLGGNLLRVATQVWR